VLETDVHYQATLSEWQCRRCSRLFQTRRTDRRPNKHSDRWL